MVGLEGVRGREEDDVGVDMVRMIESDTKVAANPISVINSMICDAVNVAVVVVVAVAEADKD
jgi:hypothetical protein